MKFALVDDIRHEATKGARGICPGCGSEVIARCGPLRADHWMHKSKNVCDMWWENETNWHRQWKEYFPAEWQEVICIDQATSERHIADIRTSDGIVLEIQHSHIDAQERKSREEFYKRMIWIVDGTRLKRDFQRFANAFNNLSEVDDEGYFKLESPEDFFPKTWLESSALLIFDFTGVDFLSSTEVLKSHLFVVHTKKGTNEKRLGIIERGDFIRKIIDGKFFIKKKPLKRYLNFKVNPGKAQSRRRRW